MKNSRGVYVGRLGICLQGFRRPPTVLAVYVVHALSSREPELLVGSLAAQREPHRREMCGGRGAGAHALLSGVRHGGSNEVGEERRGPVGRAPRAVWASSVPFPGHWESARVWAMQRARKTSSTGKNTETLSMLGVQGEQGGRCGRREGRGGLLSLPDRAAGLAAPRELPARQCKALRLINSDRNDDFAVCFVYGNCMTTSVLVRKTSCSPCSEVPCLSHTSSFASAWNLSLLPSWHTLRHPLGFK